MKIAVSLTLLFLLFAVGTGCGNSTWAKNNFNTRQATSMQDETVDFSEVRRLNRDVALKESVIITTFKETLDIYSKLDDKKFSRSEPIPTLSDDEFFILLKPKLKKLQYGDIEIVKIKSEKSALYIYYKEITNEEYLLNKLTNPIIIMRLKGNIPSSIKLESL